MNRITGAIAIAVMLALLAVVASRAFEARNQRVSEAKPNKLLEAEQKKTEERPLWRQR